MKLSTHAKIRFDERISFPLEEFLERLQTKGVLERIEKKGPRHYVLFIPEQREFYCVVVRGDEIITLMPMIWRAAQVSHQVLEEARVLATGEPSVKTFRKELFKNTLCAVFYRKGLAEKKVSLNPSASTVSLGGIHDMADFLATSRQEFVKRRLDDVLITKVAVRHEEKWVEIPVDTEFINKAVKCSTP